jgi:hypothetical protein
MFVKQFGVDVGENWVKTQFVQPKWSSQALFLQMMKCNQRLYHNYIDFFNYLDPNICGNVYA